MINHGARSDDADESPGAAADDDSRGLLLAQDRRDHPGAFRQDPEGRQASGRIHGGGAGAEMLSQSAPTDVQVCRRFIAGGIGGASRRFGVSNAERA